MRKNILILFLLVLPSDLVLGRNTNGTKSAKLISKNNNNHRINNERKKRSLDERSLPYFLPAFLNEELINKVDRYKSDIDENGRKIRFEVNKETPFWGTRGRRESASDESSAELPLSPHIHYNFFGKSKTLQKFPAYIIKQSNDEIQAPFWGNRGRRASEESDENDIELFWANRGRRQEDEPFWGTRGRRHEETPFWGNRGRRENFFMKHGSKYDEPIWGNRGRREAFEPFWGSRGKKKLRNFKTFKTFKEEPEPFWGNRGRRKIDLKETLVKAINDVQNNLKDLARGTTNKFKSLFNESNNEHLQSTYVINENSNDELSSNTFEQNTVHDDKIFAEEPHFILVERSSRSSEEDDPFYISRGKKYKFIEIAKTSRGRRGALEEIVKSVRNDPYYIARGKKDAVYSKLRNPSVVKNRHLKAKELICATVKLLAMKYNANMVKKQAIDNDRDRRTILKKLAMELQMDPYFVSRGKKVDEPAVDYKAVENFLNQINVSCN